MSDPLLSVVAPIYNEGDGVDRFVRRMDRGARRGRPAVRTGPGRRRLGRRLVGAGRPARPADERVRGMQLSRNFGKESAVLAGLEHAAGDVVVVIDSDLQHPPTAIPAMVQLLAGRRARGGGGQAQPHRAVGREPAGRQAVQRDLHPADHGGPGERDRLPAAQPRRRWTRCCGCPSTRRSSAAPAAGSASAAPPWRSTSTTARAGRPAGRSGRCSGSPSTGSPRSPRRRCTW